VPGKEAVDGGPGRGSGVRRAWARTSGLAAYSAIRLAGPLAIDDEVEQDVRARRLAPWDATGGALPAE